MEPLNGTIDLNESDSELHSARDRMVQFDGTTSSAQTILTYQYKPLVLIGLNRIPLTEG